MYHKCEYIINGRVVASIMQKEVPSCIWFYNTIEASMMDWTDRGYDDAKDIVEYSITSFFDRYGIEVEFMRG